MFQFCMAICIYMATLLMRYEQNLVTIPWCLDPHISLHCILSRQKREAWSLRGEHRSDRKLCTYVLLSDVWLTGPGIYILATKCRSAMFSNIWKTSCNHTAWKSIVECVYFRGYFDSKRILRQAQQLLVSWSVKWWGPVFFLFSMLEIYRDLLPGLEHRVSHTCHADQSTTLLS